MDNKELFFKLKALKEQYQYTVVQEEGVIKNSLKAAKVVGSHAAFLAAPVPGTALVSINNLKNGLRRTIKRAKANKRSGKPIFRQNNPVDNFDITKDVKKMGDHALHALKHPKETGKAIKDKATETLNSLKDKLKKKRILKRK